jgi:hypothetical protein
VTVTVCFEGVIFCTKSATFVNQFTITPGDFSDGGDSGSLIVTNDGNNHAVGLLFAGSSTRTIANPIGVVLNRFGVTIDGGDAGEPDPIPIQHRTPEPDPDPSDIELSAVGYKVRGLQKADLSWSGATSTNVDIYRNGNVIATVSNSGAYTDNIDNRGGGSYSYQVCEAGTSTCSAVVDVNF